MNKPHVHAQVLRDIAEGKQMQRRYAHNPEWTDCECEIVELDFGAYEYRVKPVLPKPREYYLEFTKKGALMSASFLAFEGGVLMREVIPPTRAQMIEIYKKVFRYVEVNDEAITALLIAAGGSGSES